MHAAKGRAALRQSLSETLAGIAMQPDGIRITIVHGPPASGKSYAIEEVARVSDHFVIARLSDDNASLFGFVRSIADALAPHVRGPSQSFAAMHERVSSSGEPVVAIARWLMTHVGSESLVVAVDRFERVAGESRVIALIEQLAAIGSSVRWIFSTRRMGSIPVDSWMSRGLMAMPLEAAAPGPALDLALQLTSLRRLHRQLLARTIELPALEDGLLVAFGMPEAPAALRALRGAHPELFEVGAALEYRYDVRSAVIERLRRDDPGSYVDIVRDTGAVLERERRFDEALKLYIRTLQIESLYRLLERYGLEVWETVAPDTLDLALQLIPRESQPESGIVLALRAAAASRIGRLDISETLYVNAMEISHGSVRSRIAYAYGCDLLRRNRDAVSVLQPLTHEHLEPARAAAVHSALAQAFCMREDCDNANEHIATALQLCDAASDTWTSALVRTRAAYVKFYAEGDAAAAKMHAETGVALAESCRAYVTAVGALSILYNVACEDDDPASAIPYLRKLAEHSAKIGNIDFASYALLAELEFQVEAYDTDGIARAKGTLRSFDMHYEAQAASEALLPSEAMQLAWQGDFARAYRILEPSVAQQQGDDYRALRSAQVALYAAACDALEVAASYADEAMSLLARLDVDAQKTVRARIYTAVALSILGQVGIASQLFGDVEAGASRYNRLGALARAAILIHRLWNGDTVGAELTEALLALQQLRFGGVAAMLARLPMHIALRERAAVQDRYPTPDRAKIEPLLKRYRDVAIGT